MDPNLKTDPVFADNLAQDVAANSEAVPEKTGPKFPDLDTELAAMEADGIVHFPAFVRAVRAKLGL